MSLEQRNGCDAARPDSVTPSGDPELPDSALPRPFHERPGCLGPYYADRGYLPEDVAVPFRRRPSPSQTQQAVGGAADTGRAAVQHVGVDHGRADVSVAQQFLHGPDVVVVLQQVGGKRVAKSIRILLMNRPRYGFRTATIHSPAPRFR